MHSTPYNIARRLAHTRTSSGKEMSRPAVRVAVAGIAVGIVVMLLAIAVVVGFKHEITNKVVAFGSHIQVVNFDNNNTYRLSPISPRPSLVDSLRHLPGVASVSPFCTLPGIIKTDSAFQGIVLKSLPPSSSSSPSSPSSPSSIPSSPQQGKGSGLGSSSSSPFLSPSSPSPSSPSSPSLGGISPERNSGGAAYAAGDIREGEDCSADALSSLSPLSGEDCSAEALYSPSSPSLGGISPERNSGGAADAAGDIREGEDCSAEASSPSADALSSLAEGSLPSRPNEVLLSRTLARMLGLQVGSRFFCYFIDDDVRVRRYTVAGLYDTQFADYDRLFLFAPYPEVHHLCAFDSLACSGLEIRLHDFSSLDRVASQVCDLTANRPDSSGAFLYTQTVRQLNPAIFSWLSLLDMNVIIILLLMLAVSLMCIVSGLIILILDNIRLIGTLKALGANNRFLRRIFLWEATGLVGRGMLWGNLLAFLLIALQGLFHIIPLDPSTYYISYVPVELPFWAWLALNAAVLLLSLLVLLLPSAIVSRISPSRVMHFE